MAVCCAYRVSRYAARILPAEGHDPRLPVSGRESVVPNLPARRGPDIAFRIAGHGSFRLLYHSGNWRHGTPAG
jgi:hypothetical protein